VIRDALRLVETREEQLDQLRRSLKATIDEDVWYTSDEVIEYINTRLSDDKPASEPAE
jgi:hypothetical protein